VQKLNEYERVGQNVVNHKIQASFAAYVMLENTTKEPVWHWKKQQLLKQQQIRLRKLFANIQLPPLDLS
jgi:hypothetical protein